jgi:hypothetical protein
LAGCAGPREFPLNADNRFSIQNVIGERRVTVLRLMPQWEMKDVRRGGRVLQDARLVLAAGEVVDDLEVVIGRRNVRD